MSEQTPPDLAKEHLDLGLSRVDSRGEHDAALVALIASMATSLYEMRTWVGEMHKDAYAEVEPVVRSTRARRLRDRLDRIDPVLATEYDAVLTEYEEG